MSRVEAFAFVAGGTVQAGGGVYLERQADVELLERCRAGDFTYILTSRQMGKSSLMIRTAERLAAEGAMPVIVDLTEFGAQTTAEQWYKGFLASVQDQLVAAHVLVGLVGRAVRPGLRPSLHALPARRRAGRAQRAAGGLRRRDRHHAAPRFHRRLLRRDPVPLPASRRGPDARARLSFVLIGVATPGDLIKDAARTPFNIGHGIELTDFTFDEACSLTRHLPVPETTGQGPDRVDAALDRRPPLSHAPRGAIARRSPAACLDAPMSWTSACGRCSSMPAPRPTATCSSSATC